MNQEIVIGLLRHVLTALGGLLAAKGYGDRSDFDQVAGLIIGLIGAGWSIAHKVQTSRSAAAAAAPDPAPATQTDTFPVKPPVTPSHP